ncbi:MAG: hypothetical protein AB1626_05915, partial [Candidatus Micrarchaeota archaeon]
MKALVLLLLMASLLAFGCVQGPAGPQASPTPSPTPQPVATAVPTLVQTVSVTQVPTPTPTPTPECVFANNSCCSGGVCSVIDCIEDSVLRASGCDANCTLIAECVAVSTPTPTPAPSLNPVYLGATTAFSMPEELDFPAKRVFEYRNGTLRLPNKVYKAAPEATGTEYFSFKFEWEPDYYIKERLERYGGVVMQR